MDVPTQQVAKEFMTVRVFAILDVVGMGGPCDAQRCEEDAMTVKGELGQQVLEAVQGLGARMDRLGDRMDRLETWMERLGAEFIRRHGELKEEIQGVRTELKAEIHQVRTELRAEMQEGFQQVNSRIDRTNDTMMMMGSALQRTNERIEGLDARVRALEEHQTHP